MTRALGLLCLMLLLAGQARAGEAWTCSLIDSHHFVGGKDLAQKGGGDYRIELKSTVIDLTASGHYIIGYDVAENSEHRLLGQRSFDAGGGETRVAKLALDKLNGRIVQTGLSFKGASEELVEVINGICKGPR